MSLLRNVVESLLAGRNVVEKQRVFTYLIPSAG